MTMKDIGAKRVPGSAASNQIPDPSELKGLQFNDVESLRDSLASWGIDPNTVKRWSSTSLYFVNRPDVSLCYEREGQIRLTTGGIDLLEAMRETQFTPSSVAPVFPTLESLSAAALGRFELADDTADEDMALTGDEVRGVLRERQNGRGYYIETKEGPMVLARSAVDDLDLAGGAAVNVGKTIEGRVDGSRVVEIFFKGE